ncbi:MAG: hypothetical protein RIS90_2723, partial [Pseudomonadota bacterium]
SGSLQVDSSVYAAGAMTINANGSAQVNHAVYSGGAMAVNVNGSLEVLADARLASLYAGGNQTIVAEDLLLRGGASGSSRWAGISTAGSQSIRSTGAAGIRLVGGGGTGNSAAIYQTSNATGSTQTLRLDAGGTLSLSGGTATDTWAEIVSYRSAQSIDFTNGGRLELTGGSGSGGWSFALVSARVSGSQSITGRPHVVMLGGGVSASSDKNNGAYIESIDGLQTLSVASLALNGGTSGSYNRAGVYQGGGTGSQTVNVQAGGSIVLQGGTGSTSDTNNYAQIYSSGTGQNIQFEGVGGALSLTGGTVGVNHGAFVIAANSGTQSITGVTNLTLAGGSSGGAIGSGNRAVLGADGGSQTVSAATISMLGGASGTQNFAAMVAGDANGAKAQTITAGSITMQAGGGVSNGAVIRASRQIISTTGDLTMTGGSSTFDAEISGVRIGAPGSYALDLSLNVGGRLSMTGGSVADSGAAIGNSGDGAANITVTVGDDITMTPGLLSAARIGSSAATPPAGDVNVTSLNGSLIMNSNAQARAVIGTAGQVVLRAADLDIGGRVQGSTVLARSSQGLKLRDRAFITTSATGADAIVLSAGAGQFTNTASAGSGVLSVAQTSRWLLYSNSPSDDALGGLSAGFKQYGLSYGNGDGNGNAPTALGSGLNGLLYSVSPTVSVNLVGSVSKAYDGGTLATLASANYSFSGVLDGDTVNLNYPTVGQYSSFGSATAVNNAGTGKTVTVSGLTGTVTSGAIPVYGYQIPSTASGDVGVIVPKVLNLSGSRSYDGTAQVQASVLALDGLVGQESLALSGAGMLVNKNAGDNKALTLGSLTLGNAGAGATAGLATNYTLDGGTKVASITKADLTVSSTAVSKTYDGTLSAVGMAEVIAGTLYSGDTLSGGSFAFIDKNAGTNKTVTAAGVTLDDGNSGGNYNLSYANNTASSITPKTVSLSAAKVYDGTTDLTGKVTLGELVGSETLGYTGAQASDAHVATAGKAISAITLANGTGGYGGLVSNYQLPELNSTTAAVTITPAPLSASAAIGGTLSKVYDGGTGTTAVVTGNVSGAVAGDNLSLNTSGVSLAYNSKDVLTANQIAASGNAGLVIGSSVGSQLSDYSFNAPVIAPVAAAITPKTLTINGITVADKVYDGNTAAAVSTAGVSASALQAGGLVAGDKVTVTATGTFDTKDAANGKTVTLSSNYSGEDVGNYNITSQTSTTATVTVRPVSVWTGGASGAWSNPANWDALPDGANVRVVTIPAGAAVVFDSEVGPTQLQSLTSAGSLSIAGGSLAVAG